MSIHVDAGMPTAKKNTFTLHSFLSTQVVALGIVGIGGALFLLLSQQSLAALSLGIPSLLLVLARKGITLDVANNNLRKFIRIAGIAFTYELIPFQTAERLCIIKSRVRQQLSSRGSTTTLHSELYNGYLIADGAKYLLTKNKREAVVVKKFTQLAANLHLPFANP